MNKKLLVVLSMLLAIAMFAAITLGCTEQVRTKSFGGTMTIELPKGQKLITATWKTANLWYLTRPMRSDEFPEVHEFIENSNFGVMEGKIIFKERK